uniref:rRNA adenine N(6)-methyltransferase n=2 Tax=Meloidogyne TaxID=189290 RepID=A0A914L6K6_MELIC
MGKKRKAFEDINKKGTGVRFDKLKGQHILKNPGVVHAIIEKSAIKGTDTVMEVGSGTGNMSLKIMQRAKKLIAFEIDPKMVAELQKRIIGTQNQYKLKIITGDVIKIKEWPQFDICVSNLPYKISSPFVFRLLLQRPLPRYAVLMFQKEFADRLTASPGSKCYCRLSVSVQLLAKVEHLMKVKRSEFVPPPKVDSAVVRIEPRSPPPAICYKEWDGMLRIAFMRKNKTILSLFKQKNVVNILERNYKIVCKSKGKEIPDDFSMEELIERSLVDGQFANRRARTIITAIIIFTIIYRNSSTSRFAAIASSLLSGVRFDKLKGQHILKNPGVVHAIIEKSAIKGTDTVMEVGSGTGNMSLKIMQRAKKLIAFEIDPKMVAELQKRVIGTQNER